MTPDDVVEAMGDNIAAEAEHAGIVIPGRVARCLARAAIRAVTERGGLVVGRMPADVRAQFGPERSLGHADGWNAALAAVRAAAVTIAEPPHE